MGAEPWYYFVPYQKDINKALQELRQQEFLAGRYYPASDFQQKMEDLSVSKAQHNSISEAIEDAGETGTQSILDIQEVSEYPEPCKVAPLSTEEQIECFGTEFPTHKMLVDEKKIWEVFDLIERGEALYCVVYDAEYPKEIFFAGYSFD